MPSSSPENIDLSLNEKNPSRRSFLKAALGTLGAGCFGLGGAQFFRETEYYRDLFIHNINERFNSGDALNLKIQRYKYSLNRIIYEGACSPDAETFVQPQKREDIRRLVVISDLHLAEYNVEMSQRVIEFVKKIRADVIILCGDITDKFSQDSFLSLSKILEPLAEHDGTIIATPGNHDYEGFSPELLPGLRERMSELGFLFLQNEYMSVPIGQKNMHLICLGSHLRDDMGNIKEIIQNALGVDYKVPPDDIAIVSTHEPVGIRQIQQGFMDSNIHINISVSGHTHGCGKKLIDFYRTVGNSPRLKNFLASLCIENPLNEWDRRYNLGNFVVTDGERETYHITSSGTGLHKRETYLDMIAPPEFEGRIRSSDPDIVVIEFPV